MSSGWNMMIKVNHHLTKILAFFPQLKLMQRKQFRFIFIKNFRIRLSLALFDIYSITGMRKDCVLS